MAKRPRRLVIREDQVGIYHVWTRLVRQMWLLGKEVGSGRNYEYRKEWVEDRLALLAQVFAVDACVYAILSNHYHLLLRNRPDLVAQMSDEEVVRRWWLLSPERRAVGGEPAEMTALELRSLVADAERVAELRKRLSSISWFMKTLNEWLARRANREDEVTGHFVEGRFKCRNLADEGAILVASLYIDLNEIRAGLAETPEQSRYTAGYRRILQEIQQLQRELERGATEGAAMTEPGDWLCPLDERDREVLIGPAGVESVAESRSVLAAEMATSGEAVSSVLAGKEQSATSATSARTANSAAEPGPRVGAVGGGVNGATVRKRWRHGFLPMTVGEYLRLLDWAGRVVVEGKSGSIDPSLPPILERLGLVPSILIKAVAKLDAWFGRAVGSVAAQLEAAVVPGPQPVGSQLPAADG